MVKCRSCGKRYDYEKDDFCPKCGAYNPAGGSVGSQPRQGATPPRRESPGQPARPEAQIQPPLSRGQVQRPHPQQAGPRQIQYHTPDPDRPGSARQAPRRTPEAQPRSRREEARPGRGIAVAALVVSLAVLIGSVLVLSNVMSWGQGSREPEPTALPEPVAGDFWHEPGEEFALNGVTVTVEDAWKVDLSPEFRYAKEGHQCLAVDVWITGGEKQADLVIDTPRIQLADGSQIPLDDDPFLAKELSKQYSIYAVSLRDYQWEDPLFGSFVFFVPEGEENLTLVIGEYAPGEGEEDGPRAVHSISLSPGNWP